MKHKACSKHTHRKFGLGKYLSILNRIQWVREKNTLADEKKYRSNIIKGSLSIRNYPRRGWGGEQLKHAGGCTPRPGEHAKCFKAEENARGRKMKDEDASLRRESSEHEQGLFEECCWEAGLVGRWEIGQCKQSSWKPLCRWERNMLGHSSQFRSTGALSCMQGHLRRCLKLGVGRRGCASSQTWPNNLSALQVERSAIQDWSLMSRASLF